MKKETAIYPSHRKLLGTTLAAAIMTTLSCLLVIVQYANDNPCRHTAPEAAATYSTRFSGHTIRGKDAGGKPKGESCGQSAPARLHHIRRKRARRVRVRKEQPHLLRRLSLLPAYDTLRWRHGVLPYASALLHGVDRGEHKEGLRARSERTEPTVQHPTNAPHQLHEYAYGGIPDAEK